MRAIKVSFCAMMIALFSCTTVPTMKFTGGKITNTNIYLPSDLNITKPDGDVSPDIGACTGKWQGDWVRREPEQYKPQSILIGPTIVLALEKIDDEEIWLTYAYNYEGQPIFHRLIVTYDNKFGSINFSLPTGLPNFHGLNFHYKNGLMKGEISYQGLSGLTYHWEVAMQKIE